MTDLNKAREEYKHALRSTYVSRDADECGRTYGLVDEDKADVLIAALEAELERVRELNGELAHANVLYIGSAKRLTEDRDHHRRVGEWFADKLKQAEAELTKWKEMANAQATDALDQVKSLEAELERVNRLLAEASETLDLLVNGVDS